MHIRNTHVPYIYIYKHIYIYKKEKSLKMKRCRNGMPKSTRTRKDRSDGKYTKPHPSLHLFTKQQRCRNWALYIYHHFNPFLFVYFWHAIPTSLFIFNDFSCFCTFFGNVLSCACCEVNTTSIITLYLETVLTVQ